MVLKSTMVTGVLLKVKSRRIQTKLGKKALKTQKKGAREAA